MTSFIIDLHNKCAYIYYKTEVAHYDRNSGSHISGMVAQAYRTGGSFEHRLFKNFSKTKFVSDSQWVILPEFEKTIKNKIIKVGKPLSEWSISIKFGMKTCFNDAFVIDEDTKNRICNDEPAAIEIMRPLLRGRDIQKYNCEFKNLWMITVHNGIHKYNIPPIDIDMYPVTKGFMNQYFTKLEKRIDQGITPYHLKNW